MFTSTYAKNNVMISAPICGPKLNLVHFSEGHKSFNLIKICTAIVKILSAEKDGQTNTGQPIGV
jgi:hypothetical protein